MKEACLKSSGGELDADCGLRLQAELVAREPGKNVGLTDPRVTDQHDLEEVVVLVVHPIRHMPFSPPPRSLRPTKIRPTQNSNPSTYNT